MIPIRVERRISSFATTPAFKSFKMPRMTAGDSPEDVALRRAFDFSLIAFTSIMALSNEVKVVGMAQCEAIFVLLGLASVLVYHRDLCKHREQHSGPWFV